MQSFYFFSRQSIAHEKVSIHVGYWILARHKSLVLFTVIAVCLLVFHTSHQFTR